MGRASPPRREAQVIDLAELGRPRIDVTVRISGFFRDAFPHVLALLDDAVQMVAALDEAADAELRPRPRRPGRERAPPRIFGSKPGTYGAGLLQLVDSRSWRDDADLAEVYSTWGGYAYGRGVDGVPARGAMETAYRRIAVAAKNTDTREHDIADSDDYYQYHGGMVATVRALTGTAPAAYVGDSTRPESVRTRTLHEETARVFRARVVNPRWMEAMRRHGYKGAFEMAATVDYLFGWDATTGVIADWQYEKLTSEYVLDPANREFLADSNPWALHGMAERLLEAVDRGLWEAPGGGDARRPASGLPGDRRGPGGGVVRTVYVIGIGAGDPEHLTLQAVAAMNRVDVFFTIDKGEATADLAALRKELLAPPRHPAVPGGRRPRGAARPRPRRVRRHRVVCRSGNAVAAPPRHALRGDDRRGAASRGDRRVPRLGRPGPLRRHPAPAPPDRRALPRRATHRVGPGDQQRRCPGRGARARPQPIGAPVLITTGRRLAERGMPGDVDDVVVMLDGRTAFADLPDTDLDIYWGAYLGTPDEILVAGDLHAVRDEIARGAPRPAPARAGSWTSTSSAAGC